MSDLSRFVAQKLNGEWSAGNVAGVLTDVIIEVCDGIWPMRGVPDGDRQARRRGAGPCEVSAFAARALWLVSRRLAHRDYMTERQRRPNSREPLPSSPPPLTRRPHAPPLPPARPAQYLVAGDRWESLDPLVRSRLLLAPLFMRKRELEELRPALQKLAAAGAADK